MFFFRRDSKLKKTAARRLKSPRGSAYLEFALVLPIVVMVVSAMFEFTSLWDAKIMANHAAWTCGRIATVRAGEREVPKNENDLKPLIAERPKSISDIKNADGMYLATTMLMSTCSMGSMSGSTANLVKDWVTDLIQGAVKSLQSTIENAIQNEISKIVSNALGILPNNIGSSISDVLKNALSGVFDAIGTTVLKPLTSAVANFIVGILPTEFFEKLADKIDGSRVARQLVYAADRMAKYDDIITINETLPMKGLITDFPETFDNRSQKDKWMVTKGSKWPPNGQLQRMIHVTVKWPFERAWMFPVLSTVTPPSSSSSTSSTSTESSGAPLAVGHALFYPQPTIKNANLDSANPEAFVEAETNKFADIEEQINSLKNLFCGFLKVALLSYDYRLTQELVGPYDSASVTDDIRSLYSSVNSYKGIGNYVDLSKKRNVWERLQTGFTTKDGLVFWMDRAPAHPEDQNAWKKKTCPPDYGRCFQALTGTADERCRFYHYGDAAFLFLRTGWTTECQNLLLPKIYHAKEWFYWGEKLTPHLRYDHCRGLAVPGNGWTVFSGDVYPQWRDGFEFLKNEAVMSGGLSRLPVMNLSEERFGKLKKREPAGAEIAYETWKGFVDANRPLFDLNANALFRMQTPKAAKIAELEADVFERQLRLAYEKCDELTSLVWECRAELATVIKKMEKDEKSKQDDSTSGFDLSMMPSLNEAVELMQTNPEKGLEKFREAFDELKRYVTKCVDTIDDAETDARSAYRALTNQVATVRAHRREMIEEWVPKTAAAMQNAGYLDAGVVVQIQKSQFPMSARDWAADTKAIESACQRYQTALEKLLDAEIAFAKAIGLKSQEKYKKKDVDWGSGSELDAENLKLPDHGGLEESSPESGSDKDNTNDYDFWKLEDKGWVPVSGKEDR